VRPREAGLERLYDAEGDVRLVREKPTPPACAIAARATPSSLSLRRSLPPTRVREPPLEETRPEPLSIATGVRW
jgi:hypothetical protein